LTGARLSMHAHDAEYLRELTQTERYLAWADGVMREAGVADEIIAKIRGSSNEIHKHFHSLTPGRMLHGGERIAAAPGELEVLWVDSTLNLGVRIDYPKPKSIGADRLANAAAVTGLYGFPAIVVDFGTAVTFDIVSDRRAYIGGVIAPGLEAMTNFLYQRTALLPKLSLKEPRRAIGKSTIEAMLSGAVFGYRGLVREILGRIRAERFPRKKVYTVATGGYAQLIAGRLPEISVVRPHLTLEGLRIVANLN